MNKIFFLVLLTSNSFFAQVGIGTNQPHPSAALDIQSSNKGILLPRVELHSLTDPTIGTQAENLSKENKAATKNDTLVRVKKVESNLKKTKKNTKREQSN